MATNLGTKGGFRVGQLALPGGARVLSYAGVPVDGTTGADLAAKGSLCLNYTDGKVYKNTGTKASPTWTEIGDSALATAIQALVQGTPTFTVGVEGGNKINVAVQLKDAAGSALAAKHVVRAWLSDTAGAAVTNTAPSGAVAIGTKGVVIASKTAKTHLAIASAVDGIFDLDITEAGVATWYLNIEYAGKLFSSGAITFA